MNYAFYPGCSLESSAWEYDLSTRAVCRALGIELREIADWVCCGSTPAHTRNASLAVALPAINLQKAQEMGLPVMTACASCYSRLRIANHKIQNRSEERERVARVTGKAYDGSVQAVHLLDVLANHLGPDEIRRKIVRPLSGLRIASYYGCLLTRPPEMVGFDDAEHPTCLDAVIQACGATPVQWPYKTECCGAGLSMTNSEVSCRLGHRLLSMARQAGAECLAVACPLCQINLDLRQQDAIRAHGELPATPVLYLTQILGLALGLSHDELGIDALSVSPEPLLRARQAAPAADGGSP